MLKIILYLLFITTAFSAIAGNAVLLTSVHLKDSKFKRLEKKFIEVYKNSQLTPVIHHRVKPETLYKVLTDKDTEVLIWISHAGGEHPAEKGMAAKGIILDYYGNDVKKFFTLIPPNLKFMGIVGCSAKSIFEGFEKRGNYESFPDLEIMAFDKNVRLNPGFKKVLKASQKYRLRTNSLEALEKENQNVEINVTRTGNLPISWLEMGDKVIALMNSEDPYLTINIPKNEWERSKNKNISLVRDISSDKQTSLDFLSLETSEGSSWKLFSLTDGTPIGSKDQHLYLFSSVQ